MKSASLVPVADVERTRAAWMRTDFVTYNPNIGLFCFVKFTFEFMQTGELRTSFVAEVRVRERVLMRVQV